MPLSMAFIRWLFPRLERVAPFVARRWFTKLFFSPVRFPQPAAERALLQNAQHATVAVAGKVVQVYSWGAGPAILFVHGWSGRGTQFRAFVPLFVAAGYKVVTFDGPSHGMSTGQQTTLMEFRDVMVALQAREGGFRGVVAHSIGGAAVMMALGSGLRVRTAVTLSTPAIGESILQEFATRIGGSQKAVRHLRDYFWRTFGCSFDDLTAASLVQHVHGTLNLLIVHDENDKEASIDHAYFFQQAYPAAQLLTTRGLGHVRILRDEGVVNACLQFIQNHP